MSTSKQRQSEKRPWIFKGDGSACVPGVPMRDLTEAEHAAAIEASRIVDGDPTGKLYVHETAGAKTPAEKGAN